MSLGKHRLRESHGNRPARAVEERQSAGRERPGRGGAQVALAAATEAAERASRERNALANALALLSQQAVSKDVLLCLSGDF